MPREVSLPPQPLRPLRPLRGPESEDELDPELLALPDPPKRERTLTVAVLALAALLSLAMVFALRHDVAYAFRGSASADVGSLNAVAGSTLAGGDNRFVRAEGLLGAAGGIRYERPFVDDTFRTLPVAGRRDVWVDVRVPAGQETGRWEPPRSFVGRLVRFDAAGPRHRGLAGAIERASNVDVPAGAWVLIDGDAPGQSLWTVVLAAMFLGCSLWNVVAMGRLVRRVS